MTVAMFFIARLWTMPHKRLAVADAFVLASFTILDANNLLVAQGAR